MKLGHFLYLLRTLPRGEIVRRAGRKMAGKIGAPIARRLMQARPTYCLKPPSWLSGGMAGRFPAFQLPEGERTRDHCRVLSGYSLDHRFDLLGSGWVEVKHGMRCAGTEGIVFPPGSPVFPDPEGRWLAGRINAANLAESRRLWGMIREGYDPIDWQLDFKSGYRWSEGEWHGDLAYGDTPGADVKVPWELSRMQHLVQFGWAFQHARSGFPGFSPPPVYAWEFRHQVLDFLVQNPPGFGVNWSCAMDVGIRVANWVMARDLFVNAGAEFDAGFETVFARGVYEHGCHLIRNLEWSPRLHGNHYLADLAGLAYAAGFLPPAPETDAWLFFCLRELVDEAESQFFPDGSNFEASTCYHRLSAEMLAYATVLFLALPAERLIGLQVRPGRHQRFLPRFAKSSSLSFRAVEGWGAIPFPPWYLERLERAAEFTRDMTWPEGRVPQIGDCDSGRFFKLFPVSQKDPWSDGFSEDFLDHRHLVAAINGFFRRKDFEDFAGEPALETRFVSALLRGKTFSSTRPPVPASPPPAQGSGLRFRAYPDFGLFLCRGAGFHLAFRCGPIGQNENGGHAHNDQLSFILAVKGLVFLEDPGTYLYTPAWDARNAFRSTAYHNTLSLAGREQNPWEQGRRGLFNLISKSRARLVEAGPGAMEGEHSGFGIPHRRKLLISPGRVEGTDDCGANEPLLVRFHFHPEVLLSLSPDGNILKAARGEVRLAFGKEAGDWRLESGWSSPAYGTRRKAPAAVLEVRDANPAKWRIEWNE